MIQPYAKPWTCVEDQLDKLIGRGITVTDRAKALDYLERIGYYRLSGYWFAFRERSSFCLLDPATGGKPAKVRIERPVLDDFKAGTTFQNAVDLYVFDKKLRLLAMDALERIEIALRVDISHRLGKLSTFAHIRPDLFHDNFAIKPDPKTGLPKHHSWLTKNASLISRSGEEFITHNKEKYGLPLAIWVACEVWDFGCMSWLFGGMKETDQDHIAQQYGISNGRVFASWLRSLNYLRNVCAHHSRLWNRNIVDQPKLPSPTEVVSLTGFHGNAHALARPFLLLCIAQHMMKHINPSSTWGQRLKILLETGFPNLDHLGLNLLGMGADKDWNKRDW